MRSRTGPRIGNAVISKRLDGKTYQRQLVERSPAEGLALLLEGYTGCIADRGARLGPEPGRCAGCKGDVQRPPLQGHHLRVADLDPLWLVACIKLASHRQAGPGRSGTPLTEP